MKATLETRKSVRLNWFKQKKVPFELKRTLEWSYYKSNVVSNEIGHSASMQYTFSGLKNPIPATNILMFEDDLPQAYLYTSGSVGEKFNTDKLQDSSVTIIDRIVKVDQGEEKVTKKPVPPHEAHMFKELQIHERKDKITRKITVKNETHRPISLMELTFIENSEIQFIKSTPIPKVKDAPEYSWEIEIPAEKSVVIEITVENHIKNVYKIEKDNDKGKQRA
ncbi:MAG: hypothetical protein FK733_19320 [Asgard group archaeon]|nr:hypothetical protein [Asgard group archaeon]